ncbi:MAG TPA: FtsX-like permease family protein [Microlunatus sp.]
MAGQTFRDRWQVFVGAIVTVCLGVALVQSSLLALISAATAAVPPGLSQAGAAALQEGYDYAVTLLGMVLGLATFVAVFIVGTTFAFTVAQRRQELSLLRLTGASRGQIRSLLVGEAVLLGLIGSAVGALLGLPVMRLQVWMLIRLDFAPPGFTARWLPWVLLVSIGAGVLISVLGVLAASLRAARIRPLEALRETGEAVRVMTASRWVLGILCTAGGVLLLALFPAGDTERPVWFVQLTPFLVSVPLVVGFSALAPLIVPLVGRLLGLIFHGRLAELALANLRFDARRSASTAAPIMVLVAFVASIGATLGSVSAAAQQETLHSVRGDLMVLTDRPAASELAGVDGVDSVSPQTTVRFELRSGDDYGNVWYLPYDGLAADPVSYGRAHQVRAAAGDLADLTGPAIAVSPSADPGRDWQVGDILQLRVDGKERAVHIVALLPSTVSGPYFVLSPELVPPDAGPWQNIVRLADHADEPDVEAALGEFGSVQTLREWVDEGAAAQDRATGHIMIVLLSMTMLYTVIAIINAVVIAASGRRREFAVARVTGLSRGQVVRVAFWESQAVVIIGLLLGGVAAAGSVVGVSVAIHRLIGITVISIPWPLLIGLALGAAVLVGVTSVVTSRSHTRTPPVRLIGARE